MSDIALDQRGALGIDAANGDLGFVFHEVGFANRAGLGKDIRHGIRWAFGLHHAHHLGNDVAAFFQNDRIAFPNIFALDFLGIVQGGALDRRARQLHGFEVRHWGDDARASHLKRDVLKHGLGLFRRVFVGDRPAGIFGCRAELVLLYEVVDLDHDAIDVVGQVRAFFLPLARKSDDLIHIVAQFVMGIDGQAEGLHPREILRVGRGLIRRAKSISEKAQPPLGHQPRILQLE